MTPCRQCGAPHTNVAFCSRSCACRYTRSQQTPAQRKAMSIEARRKQSADVAERLLARVKCLADTERGRILAAFRLGKAAAKSQRYRDRQQTGTVTA